LTVCFIRLFKNHYLINHYLGLVMAIWYWHFVDAIWIVVFLLVYCWGNW
jgi:cytochrome c oxidase subunit 3